MWKQLSNVIPQTVIDAAESVRSRLGYSPSDSPTRVHVLSLTILYLPVANLLPSPPSSHAAV